MILSLSKLYKIDFEYNICIYLFIIIWLLKGCQKTFLSLDYMNVAVVDGDETIGKNRRRDL